MRSLQKNKYCCKVHLVGFGGLLDRDKCKEEKAALNTPTPKKAEKRPARKQTEEEEREAAEAREKARLRQQKRCLCMSSQKKRRELEKRSYHKITSADELVKKTVCEVVKRACIERECANCGVQELIGVINEKIGDMEGEHKEWKRWQKTEM
ncbi:hypothetical protein PoB_007574500 [Plakobranchus ocellatus]|uniref:Uncharacterized protein n=1 Tax=Plakobranchus ocellatus TaxID=259542 RepID=A0AAV4DYH2_9GAST|nr:hypothetical protein PoB_007574500 [Plakobranchus ocellatus]